MTEEMVSGPLEGHRGRVLSCTFSPDGQYVVSGSADKTIQVWDVGTGSIVLGPFEGHTGSVTSVAVSPDGEFIASGSGDKTICIWNAATGHPISGPFEGHTDSVMSVAFSLDGKRIVSGSADKTVRIWHAEADRPDSDSPPSVIVAGPTTHRSVVSSPVAQRFWNAGSLTLPCGFLLDHSSGWASSQHSTDTATGSQEEPLLFWVPPHNRRGICGSETITIMGTPLNRLDFHQFMHGSSWAQCYVPPAPTIRRSVSPLPLNVLPQGGTSSLLLRILGLLLLLGMLSWRLDVIQSICADYGFSRLSLVDFRLV